MIEMKQFIKIQENDIVDLKNQLNVKDSRVQELEEELSQLKVMIDMANNQLDDLIQEKEDLFTENS